MSGFMRTPPGPCSGPLDLFKGDLCPTAHRNILHIFPMFCQQFVFLPSLMLLLWTRPALKQFVFPLPVENSGWTHFVVGQTCFLLIASIHPGRGILPHLAFLTFLCPHTFPWMMAKRAAEKGSVLSLSRCQTEGDSSTLLPQPLHLSLQQLLNITSDTHTHAHTHPHTLSFNFNLLNVTSCCQ